MVGQKYITVGECEARYKSIEEKLNLILGMIKEVKDQVSSWSEYSSNVRADVNNQKVTIAEMKKDIESLQKWRRDVENEDYAEVAAFKNAKWYFIITILLLLVTTFLQVRGWIGETT